MTTNTNPARGMRDFLPADIRKRNYVIGIIREVYEKYGFEPLETPAIENLATLNNKSGEESDQLMFKILKRGKKLEKQLKRDDAKENDLTDLALRYDLTVPLARVIANSRNVLPKFFKRYQIQPVWRADRPAKGRYREFYQCDVDAIGSKSMLVEAELCSAVYEILERLGFDDFVIRINSRTLLSEILEVAGVPKDKHGMALVAFDKLDKIGEAGVAKELLERGISEDASKALLNFFASLIESDIQGQIGSASVKKLVSLYDYVFKGIERLSKEIKEFDKSDENELQVARRNRENLYIIVGIAQFLVKKSGDADFASKSTIEIISLLKLVENTRFSANLIIDPSLARGLSYYTGMIFEVILTNGDFSGSIAGGGRYDGLIGMFGKEDIPAVGLSLGLERILYVMEERGMFPDDLQTNAADVLVTLWNEESAGESLKLASELRKKDLRVLVYPQADKLGKQFKYADQIDVEYVCVLGDTELAENTVQVKNMKTGDQVNIAREDVGSKIKV